MRQPLDESDYNGMHEVEMDCDGDEARRGDHAVVLKAAVEEFVRCQACEMTPTAFVGAGNIPRLRLGLPILCYHGRESAEHRNAPPAVIASSPPSLRSKLQVRFVQASVVSTVRSCSQRLSREQNKSGILCLASLSTDGEEDEESRDAVPTSVSKNVPQGVVSVCAFEGDLAKLQAELKKSPENANESNADGWTALMWACRAGKVDCVELLLASGADLRAANKFESTSMHHAAHWGHVSVIETLLRTVGTAVERKELIEARNKFGWTPLHWAGKGGHAAAAKTIMEAGGDPRAVHMFGNTPLHEAVNSGNVDVVKVMLPKSNVNAQNGEGETPLMSAAYLGFADVVRALLDAGADMHLQDKEGNTPLHRAARGGHEDVVEDLLRAGAEVNIPAGDIRSTPLHEAARWGRFDIVQLLVDHNADVNCANSDGDTPLHMAAVWGRSWDDSECIEILLRNRADYEIRNKAGLTALEVAKIGCDAEEFADSEVATAFREALGAATL